MRSQVSTCKGPDSRSLQLGWGHTCKKSAWKVQARSCVKRQCHVLGTCEVPFRGVRLSKIAHMLRNGIDTYLTGKIFDPQTLETIVTVAVVRTSPRWPSLYLPHAPVPYSSPHRRWMYRRMLPSQHLIHIDILEREGPTTWPLRVVLSGNSYTLWHKIVTYEKLFWNKYFRTKLRISRVIPWKWLSFLDILRAQSPSKITKKNSQGIIFAIVSCQRVPDCAFCSSIELEGLCFAAYSSRDSHWTILLQVHDWTCLSNSPCHRCCFSLWCRSITGKAARRPSLATFCKCSSFENSRHADLDYCSILWVPCPEQLLRSPSQDCWGGHLLVRIRANNCDLPSNSEFKLQLSVRFFSSPFAMKLLA